jgi:nitroreductase
MELREVIGRRRSIRFMRTYQPVEREKIQRMLEAARLGSFWGNVQALNAVVVERHTATPEVLEALTAPVAGFQIRRAPVVIVWYLDMAAVDEQPHRLRELLEAGALGVGPNKKEDLETKIIPFFQSILELLKAPGINEMDAGQGIAQATLMAYEQGLGTCLLGGTNTELIRENLGLPDTCRVLILQTVGYPAEHWEAGGQRPRKPFEQRFFLNGYGTPFPRSQEVVDELTEQGMFTTPGPLPHREAELEFLRDALKVPGSGLI